LGGITTPILTNDVMRPAHQRLSTERRDILSISLVLGKSEIFPTCHRNFKALIIDQSPVAGISKLVHSKVRVVKINDVSDIDRSYFGAVDSLFVSGICD
jgi:hypothetical protein